MSISTSNAKNIFFLGQNSHGTAEPWEYRRQRISSRCPEERIAVVMECPTADMILYELRKQTSGEEYLKKALMTSCYWWVRSKQFFGFLSHLPSHAHIFGIDAPFEIANHRIFISKLGLSDISEYNMMSRLLEVDMINNVTISELSPVQRERILYQKLKVILTGEYDYIYIICHNFHATKLSWFDFLSLCQRLLLEKTTDLTVFSVGSFARTMEFISTDGDRLLNRHTLSGSLKDLSESSFEVKMVSSLYRSETSDALPLVVSIPEHFDEIVIRDNESAVCMEELHA